MNDQMKQRAVGAAVLVALAIIFIPMALDFSKEKAQETVDLSLPPPPEGEYKTVTIPMKEWSDKTVADVLPERALPDNDVAEVLLDAEPVTPAVPVAVDPKPMVAEGTGAESQATPPETTAAAAPEVPPKQQIDPKPAAVAKAPVTESKSQPKIAPKPQLAGPATGAQAWAVQVGSFSQRKNAEALRNRLRKMGYPAFVTSTQSNGRTIVRVKIGPELARSEADRIKSDIERQLKLQAMVVPHK